jgi:hypothetical protein
MHSGAKFLKTEEIKCSVERARICRFVKLMTNMTERNVRERIGEVLHILDDNSRASIQHWGIDSLNH